jgi:prepilin-type N-terminal cleavage/methylation domain-containing protein/prepilin-type processing-associated H-X9-DG protein
MKRRNGFTLVELLVVIGIIAVLIGILLPALSKARTASTFTVCAERERQLVMAMQLYANENRGFFPRHDFGSGGNLWDVKTDLYDIFRQRYNILHKMFFCPDTDPALPVTLYKTYLPTFYRIGYSYWVPRKNNNGFTPPDPGAPGNSYQIKDKDVFRGPISIGDRYANFNPVLTDTVLTDPNSSPDADLSRDALAMRSPEAWTPHRGKAGVLLAINAAWADGHVTRIQATEVKARYKGNWWNWR